LSGTGAEGSAIEKCSSRSAESLGMKTVKQRHRDKDKCRCRQGKIGRFAITKNISRRHGHSPTNRCVIVVCLHMGFHGGICDGFENKELIFRLSQ
jgi:hypothetical protein